MRFPALILVCTLWIRELFYNICQKQFQEVYPGCAHLQFLLGIAILAWNNLTDIGYNLEVNTVRHCKQYMENSIWSVRKIVLQPKSVVCLIFYFFLTPV